MSFDTDYPNRKDWRKPYRRSASFDRSCRPGGSCPFCTENRTFSGSRRQRVAEEKLREAFLEISPKATLLGTLLCFTDTAGPPEAQTLGEGLYLGKREGGVGEILPVAVREDP